MVLSKCVPPHRDSVGEEGYFQVRFLTPKTITNPNVKLKIDNRCDSSTVTLLIHQQLRWIEGRRRDKQSIVPLLFSLRFRQVCSWKASHDKNGNKRKRIIKKSKRKQ